jgi:hypothetical protein
LKVLLAPAGTDTCSTSIWCAAARCRRASSKGRATASTHCPKIPGTTSTRYGDVNDASTLPGVPAGHRYRPQSSHWPGTWRSTPQKSRANAWLDGSFSSLIGAVRNGGEGSTTSGTARVHAAVSASTASAPCAALIMATGILITRASFDEPPSRTEWIYHFICTDSRSIRPRTTAAGTPKLGVP